MMQTRTLLLLCVLSMAATVSAGTWRPYEKNPVLGNKTLGTCFDVNVVTDGPAPYTMYFSWRPKKAIALVRSADGFTWTQEPEICLESDPTSGWENDLNRSCTVKKDGVWHMWYTGQVYENGNWRKGWSRIGFATSTDGVRFTRVRKDPVLVPDLPFEKTSVMNPYVRWDAQRAVWRMWYAAGEIYEPNVLCYAESKDGLVWKKRPEPIFGHGAPLSWDRDRVGACEVHPLPDGRWAMFYIGYSDIDTARIGCAISPDGITDWTRLAQNPIVAPDLGTWNGSACYKPSVVRDEKNKRWLLWYNGRNGAPEYVGMAFHEGLDLESPAAAPTDTKAILSDYVRRFNAKDDECYTNAIPNARAEAFMLENCPRFACPDKDIERTYYFRWWTFRKHLKRGEKGGWRVTEFLPKVPWSGKDNTIVCPAGHHLREGRWLRDLQFIEDDARFWLSDPEATHRWMYSSWLFTGTRLVAEVTGRDGLPGELLDNAVRYYERWEKGFVYERGLPMGGDGKGGFLSIDNHEGTELSLGGSGYKPLFSSAMWSEAKAISEVAAQLGRTELAERFAAKAEAARQSLFDRCWNPDVGFFTTCPTNGPKGVVRELHGYAPWYFGVPTDGRRPDWAQLADPQGFAATYGLTFPERRAKGFAIDYKGHECKWNGPSWPFATSIVLTALANDLHAAASENCTSSPSPSSSPSPLLFTSLLWQYADAQRRTHPTKWDTPAGDWEVVPWIDENLHPDKAEWLSREIILRTPEVVKRFPRERGKDYNHSTFCDLVISGLVGFVPKGDKGFAVDPLFPATWDYLVLENLRYRGHDVAVRWRRGEGLAVSVDGKPFASRVTLGRLDVSFTAEADEPPRYLRVAASNSSAADKRQADFVCRGAHDEDVVNAAVERLTKGGTVQLLDGDYHFEAFPREGNSMVCAGYNNGVARVVNLVGTTENKSYNTAFGAVIHVTERAMKSIDPAKGEYRVFYGAAKKPEAKPDWFTYTHVNNMNFENFYLKFANASKPLVGIDCRNFGSSYMKLVGVYSEQYFRDRFEHLKPATPAKGTVGIVTTGHSNDEMARIGFDWVNVGGLHTGFRFVGTDHVVMRACTTARCCVGYDFSSMAKTLTLLNCCDEGNTHLPVFRGRGQVTMIDFNVERFNAAYIPDDPDGNAEPYATEESPGAWRGMLTYTLQGKAFDLKGFWKPGHGTGFETRCLNARP